MKDSHLTRSRGFVAVAAVVLALVVAGCTGTNGDDRPLASVNIPPQGTPSPRTGGDKCDDATGDMTDNPRAATGNLTEPAGIDIVHASAKLDDTALTVVFETAGPIDTAANPLFVVLQGSTAQAIEQSFELRAQPNQANQWGVTLVTFKGQQENRQPLTVPVTVNGSQLTYVIPKSMIPTVATILWSFGSSGGISSNNRVTDDCEPFVTPSSTAPSGTRPAASAPSTTVATKTGVVGQPATAADGSKVTVRTIDNPAKPTRQLTAQPIDQYQLAAIDVEACGGTADTSQIGEGQFTLQTADGRSFDPWAANDFTNEPRFTLQATVRNGECVQGWIDFEIPKDAQVASVTYDAGGKKVGPYVIIKPA